MHMALCDNVHFTVRFLQFTENVQWNGFNGHETVIIVQHKILHVITFHFISVKEVI